MSVEEEGRARWLREHPAVTSGEEGHPDYWMPDALFRERHHLVAHLAAIYPSVMVLNADPAEPDWPIVYITLPTGQVSWHISPGDMDLFRHVPVGSAEWDGHDVVEKYRRLDASTTGGPWADLPDGGTGTA